MRTPWLLLAAGLAAGAVRAQDVYYHTSEGLRSTPRPVFGLYGPWAWLAIAGALAMFSDINDQLTPLAASLGVVTAQMADLAPAGVAKPTPEVTVLTFRGQGRTVQAVWTTQGEQEVTLPAGGEATAVGLFGRPVAVRRQGEGVVLKAGPWPVYMTMRE